LFVRARRKEYNSTEKYATVVVVLDRNSFNAQLLDPAPYPRATISLFSSSSFPANSHRKYVKAKCIQRVIAAVRSQSPPGRFVEFTNGVYVESAPNRVYDKTSQALRDSKRVWNDDKVLEPRLHPALLSPGGGDGVYDEAGDGSSTCSDDESMASSGARSSAYYDEAEPHEAAAAASDYPVSGTPPASSSLPGASTASTTNATPRRAKAPVLLPPPAASAQDLRACSRWSAERSTQWCRRSRS
jgi:hypothetical protein